MAPSQNGPGQEGIKFNQSAGIIFHGTEKPEKETGVSGEDVGRRSTVNNATRENGKTNTLCASKHSLKSLWFGHPFHTLATCIILQQAIIAGGLINRHNLRCLICLIGLIRFCLDCRLQWDTVKCRVCFIRNYVFIFNTFSDCGLRPILLLITFSIILTRM